MPFLSNFQPDLLLVSAGYDANLDDPLARMNLQPQDYGLFTQYCLKVTPKIVFGLEGGYDLPTLSQSVIATVESVISEQLTVNSYQLQFPRKALSVTTTRISA